MMSMIWPAASRMMRPYGKGRSTTAVSSVKDALPQAVPVEQPADGVRAEQRRVAVEDQQVAAEILERCGRLQHGVACPQRLVLHDELVSGAQMFPNLLPCRTQDHVDVLWRYHSQCVLDNAIEDGAVPQG